MSQENNITPLMYAVKKQNVTLNAYLNYVNEAPIRYFLKYYDTNKPILPHYKPLLDALNNKNLNLNQEQLTDLIQQDLKQSVIYNNYDRYDWHLLIDAFRNNNNQNLNQKIYNAFNEEQKQEFFKALSEEYLVFIFKEDNSYLEAINTMLYNFKFQPNEETINYLKKNKNQDILSMIEKNLDMLEIIKNRDISFLVNLKNTDITPLLYALKHQKNAPNLNAAEEKTPLISPLLYALKKQEEQNQFNLPLPNNPNNSAQLIAEMRNGNKPSNGNGNGNGNYKP